MAIAYFIFVFGWTLYMAFENYFFTRPQSRPYWVGFVITHAALAPMSFALSATSGILRERVTDAYRSASDRKQAFFDSAQKKPLIG
jgi:hypothetical protein